MKEQALVDYVEYGVAETADYTEARTLIQGVGGSFVVPVTGSTLHAKVAKAEADELAHSALLVAAEEVEHQSPSGLETYKAKLPAYRLRFELVAPKTTLIRPIAEGN